MMWKVKHIETYGFKGCIKVFVLYFKGFNPVDNFVVRKVGLKRTNALTKKTNMNIKEYVFIRFCDMKSENKG